MRASSSSTERGRDAEAAAEAFLCARGLRMVARNYRCRLGEVDLIMRDAELLVFVEVRFRSRSDYGGGVLSVNRRKQARVARVAAQFLRARAVPDSVACRFDVVSLGPGASDVEWIPDAFEVSSWT